MTRYVVRVYCNGKRQPLKLQSTSYLRARELAERATRANPDARVKVCEIVAR